MKTYTRYLAVVFAVAMMICALTSVSASFEDVSNDNPHIDAIQTMTNLGIIGGYEDGTFRPDGLVRRDEMAKIVFVASTSIKDVTEGERVFPDVSPKNWANAYISWCAGKGIVGGYEDGTFRPAGNITYDEALKMVCAMLGYTDIPGMWPYNVRTKAIIELELNDGLEEAVYDAPLTRAQVVQLVYNALDKPMYQEPIEIDTPIFSGVQQTPSVKSLKSSVWGFEEIKAQVVGTENYGLMEFDEYDEATDTYTKILDLTTANVITDGTKTGYEDEIQVKYLDENGNAVYEKLTLEECALTEYIGKTDDIIAYQINLIKREGYEGYVSASLMGTKKVGISGASVNGAGYPNSECVWNSTTEQYRFVKQAVSIDAVVYTGDDFRNLRRLSYYGDKVLITNNHINGLGEYVSTEVATEGTDAYKKYGAQATTTRYTAGEKYGYIYAWADNDGRISGSVDRWQQNFSKALNDASSNAGYVAGVDKDGDGVYDYLTIEIPELYRVVSANSSNVTFEYLYNTTEKTYLPMTGIPGIGLATMDLKFPTKNVSMISDLKAGDIVLGYVVGDSFTVVKEPTTEIGYIVSMSGTGTGQSMTLNTGSKISGIYSYSNCWAGRNEKGTPVTEFNKKFSDAGLSMLGINASLGNYAYAKYWHIDNKFVWGELVDPAVIEAGSGLNKAILLYTTEATEPQVNENTKEYEIFYPAYLVIGGRTQLVNLNANDAIDGWSGQHVSESNDYRPYLAYDFEDGQDRVMYQNKLVTYKIDENGYYTLSESASTLLDESSNVIEKVIDFNANYSMVINKDNGIITIEENTGTDANPVYAEVQSRIVVDDDSIVYYTYTKNKTGIHEYIDYYKGNEIPTDFERIDITSDIYLKYEKETGLYILSAVMVDDAFTGTSTTVTDYKTDARHHLFAMTDVEVVAHNEEVYASYNFKDIYKFEDTTLVNRSIDYSSATKAVAGKIYAWDSQSKDYVEVPYYSNVAPGNEYKSLYNDVITEILGDMSVIFTANFADGLKIDDTVKIIAVTDIETQEIREISFEELIELYDNLAQYDIDEETLITTPLKAKIGVYEDTNKTKAAYIIVNWVEYDKELEEYTFAGSTDYSDYSNW